MWYKEGVKLIESNFKIKLNINIVKSVILFFGDGMGIIIIIVMWFFVG